MLKTSKEQFDWLLKEAKPNPNIIGFFLGGSRGKGFETKFSDYDIYMIVRDDIADFYRKKYKAISNQDIELFIYSFIEFRKHAYWGGPEEWARYNFAHIKVLIDKNKKIQKLVNEKSKIPKNKIKSFIRDKLDGYINYVYRSIKCLRDKDLFAARLEAAYSISLFLDIIFALDEGRIKPYGKYLKWELINFPLKKFPMKPKEIIKSISKILDDADLKTQQRLLRVCEKIFRKEGYGKVFDDWKNKDKWAMKFRS